MLINHSKLCLLVVCSSFLQVVAADQDLGSGIYISGGGFCQNQTGLVVS